MKLTDLAPIAICILVITIILNMGGICTVWCPPNWLIIILDILSMFIGLIILYYYIFSQESKRVSPKCQESESKVTSLEGKKGKEFRKR